MSLSKRVTLQLAQRRGRLKNQIVRKQEDLSRKQANPPTFIQEPGTDVGCAPCQDGMLTECNIEWQQRRPAGGNGIVQVVVDGSKATFETLVTDTANIQEWVDVWPNGASLPIEVLTRIKFRWDWDSDGWDMLLQVDGQPDPPGSELWAYLGFDSDNNGNFASHTFDLQANIATSEPVGTSTTTIWTSPTVGENADVSVEMNIRFRVESGAVRAKVWVNGTAEPGAWTLEDTGDLSALDGAIVSLGFMILGIDNEGGLDGSKNYFDVEFIQITEGCDTNHCLETFTRTESGELGDSEFGTQEITCIDTFTRTVTSGWGTSEINGNEWTHTGQSAFDVVSVIGRIQNITTSPTQYQYLDVSVQPPIELLWTFNVTELASGSSVACGLGVRTIGGHFSDDDYATLHVNILDDLFRIQLTSETFNGSMVQIYSDSTEWSGKTLFIRMRVEGSTIYGKIWKTVDDEPTAWQTTATGTLPTGPAVIKVSAISGDGPGWHRIFISEVEITDGCVEGCDRDILNQKGVLGIGSPAGTSDGTLLVSRLMVMGLCLRVSSSQYRLPTTATHVATVSVDGLRITGWMWESPRDIFLPSEVDASTRVFARYFQT